jgi:heat shock protein HtpX
MARPLISQSPKRAGSAPPRPPISSFGLGFLAVQRLAPGFRFGQSAHCSRAERPLPFRSGCIRLSVFPGLCRFRRVGGVIVIAHGRVTRSGSLLKNILQDPISSLTSDEIKTPVPRLAKVGRSPERKMSMNLVRTAMLLALMTALFMGVGISDWRHRRDDDRSGDCGWHEPVFLLELGQDGAADAHAVEVDASTAPEFYQMVADLAQNAGLPMPRVYVIRNAQPNAFATGRNPENAAVAASTGLLESLTEEEIAAVMAHELAHVQHRDTLTMTITATLAGAISMLGNFALFFGGNRNNNPLGFIGILVAMIVAPVCCDAGADDDQPHPRICRGQARRGNLRQSLWLASALRKIALGAGRDGQ